MIFEGFGVDHLHAKLFPMHGPRQAERARRMSGIDTCFDRYEGSISSHDSARADDATLAALARRLRDEAALYVGTPPMDGGRFLTARSCPCDRAG